MLDEERRRYLFEKHSEEEVRSWCERLRYFRYFRAPGGHANDMDSLDAAISYSGEEEIIAILIGLGIHPAIHTEKAPKPGVAYFEEFERFPSLIEGTKWMEQPGRTTITGEPVFVWCEGGRILISVDGIPGEITEDSIRSARRIEGVLERWGDRIPDPPRDSMQYLCVANYPFLGEEN